MKKTQKKIRKLKIISLKLIYNALSELILIVRYNKLIQLKIAIGLFLLSSKSLYSQEKILLENTPNQADSLNLDFELEAGETLCYEVVVVSKKWKEPQYKGGQNALNKFILENLQYPQKAIDNNIEGYVIVSTTIDEKGYHSNANIVRGMGYGLDEEALRLVGLMPKFKPGKKWGKKADMNKTITIYFKFPQD